MDDNHPRVPPGPVRLITLARLARVHVSTVSRALSEDTSGVSVETVLRIRELAKSLGYRKDAGAAGLRTGKSRLIGVLVPRVTDIVMATVYESIDSAAAAAGYSTVVANTFDNRVLREDRLDALLSRRLDGIILGDSRIADTATDQLETMGVPYILVMRRLENHLSVSTDDRIGGRLAAEHLLNLGHTRAAVIAGDLLASTGRERTEGFLEVFRAAGHIVDSRYVVSCGFGAAAGRSAGAKILSHSDRPTAIFAVDDLTAIGAMGAIRAAGLRLREDVALVGYNDIEICSDLPVPLTSVRSPLADMGRLSVELLLRRIGNQPVESQLLVPSLVIRETTLAESANALTWHD